MRIICRTPAASPARALGDRVVERVQRAVWSGELRPGEPVREQRFAEELRLSRSPVRDALLRLTRHGLLVAEPNRGVRVAPRVAPATRRLLVDTRRRIEVHALRQGMPVEADAAAELCENLTRFRAACAAGDLAEVVSLDMAFHRQLVLLDPDRALETVWLPVVTPLTLPYSRHANLLESHAEHARIVDAIEAGDEAAAVAALKENIQ